MDIFDMFLGGGLGGGRQRGPRRTANSTHEIGVSLEDMYNGATRKLALQKNVICDECDGERNFHLIFRSLLMYSIRCLQELEVQMERYSLVHLAEGLERKWVTWLPLKKRFVVNCNNFVKTDSYSTNRSRHNASNSIPVCWLPWKGWEDRS